MTIWTIFVMVHLFGNPYVQANDQPETECFGSNKFVKSKSIIIKKILEQHYLKNDCPLPEDDKPSSITLFAMDTIFVDADIHRPGERLNLIAENWIVEGNRTIDLSGFNADSDEESADDCKVHPGKNGEPGGHFWGFGKKFINGQNLKIVANGGKGGPGKNGCPGMNGTDGHSRPFDRFKCNEYWENENLTDHRETCACLQLRYKTAFIPRYYKCSFSGSPGEKGKSGGDGGMGGKGGNSGLINIVEFESKSEIRTQAVVGENGIDGIGGPGGFGGKQGDDRIFNCDSDTRQTWFSDHYYCEESIKSSPNRSPRGETGRNGTNVVGTLSPIEFKRIQRALNITNGYKYFLHTSLQSQLEPSTFYDHLKNKVKIYGKNDLLRSL